MFVTISGIRGIAGKDLTPHEVVSYVCAFAQMTRAKRIVLGHDARPSAHWILPLVEGALRGVGVEVLFSGLTPTPTLGLLVRMLKADGGINVTASHNPIEYNGLKFFSRTGSFITKEMLAGLIEAHRLIEAGEIAGSDRIGARTTLKDPAQHHLAALLKALPPRVARSGARRLRVVIDCCNSTGAMLAPRVAEAYGATHKTIFADVDAFVFPRGAEPVEENLKELRRQVIARKAALGFAIDPDADRLALVDENGRAIGEERTLVLAADSYLSMTKRKSSIVVNLSTSSAIEDVARKHGTQVIRTAIGEANVLAGLEDSGARIGGEGNGGVIVPAVQPGRDAATGIALILMGLQARGGTLSQWNEEFPSYAMIKKSMHVDRDLMNRCIARLPQSFQGASIDLSDGMKASFPDCWIHVRPSNTEPVVRVYAEGRTPSSARELVERAAKALQ
ncbi:phosphoglucosamine mutase [Candidatus Sumerlaeota bacterium]|nr:phosphoglucosamine mutase [Candidatus Sumerlaeota bacterium]